MCNCNKKVNHIINTTSRSPSSRNGSKNIINSTSQTRSLQNRSGTINRTQTYYHNYNLSLYKTKQTKTRQINSISKQVTKKNTEITTNDIESWDIIHQMAATAVTHQHKQEFIDYMNYLSENFPCPACSEHIKLKLNQIPLTSLPNIIENGRDISYAKWSWEFHNEINTKLSKSTVSWDYFSKKYI